MSEDNGEMTGGGKKESRPSSAVVKSPLEDENLLRLILCHLPSAPCSLLRASLVCREWRSVVSDPRFLSDFRAHHLEPPIIGFFCGDFFGENVEFATLLGPSPSDYIPAARFSLTVRRGSRVLRCSHGRVLILNQEEQQFLAWDPVTGELLSIAFPPGLDGKMMRVIDGGVICVATAQGHVHGACHSDPFRLVFVGEDRERFFACVYSSDTMAWGNLFSIMRLPYFVRYSANCPGTMSGNSISLLLSGEQAAILEFDWGRGDLAYIDVPSEAYKFDAIIGGMCQFTITTSDSGGLMFILLSSFSVYLWKRVSSGDGIAGWVLGDTIQLRNLLSLNPIMPLTIMGLDEDNNVILKLTDTVVFLVNLETMQFKKVFAQLPFYAFSCHPFKSFYTPGARVTAGHGDIGTLPGA